MCKSILAAVILTQVIGGAAIAQNAPAEFGRVSGGQIEATTKQAAKLSGSLTLTQTSAPGSGFKGYGATLGGTIVEDRLWFFATTDQQPGFRFATTLPDVANRFERSAFVKSTAQAGDRHVLDAAFASGPTNFLSLHYQAALSSNSFFTGTFTRSKTNAPTIFGTLGQ